MLQQTLVTGLSHSGGPGSLLHPSMLGHFGDFPPDAAKGPVDARDLAVSRPLLKDFCEGFFVLGSTNKKNNNFCYCGCYYRCSVDPT